MCPVRTSGEQVSYNYDALKRLIKAETTQSGGSQWGQQFGFDGWGNMVSKGPTANHSGTSFSIAIDPTTNRPTSTDFVFDANGNMTSMPSTPNAVTLNYDIENRTGGSWYDQQNQPLNRDGSWNVYGLRGERLATYSFSVTSTVYNMGQFLWIWRYSTATQTSRNVYFGGRLIQSNGKVVLTDRLGSVRVDETGAKANYYPYGEQQSGAMGDGREKFGTYTRESSTGLDYANQRYYASVYGRFNTADPYRASAGAGDPGSWNRYAYVGGDPANFADPRGLYRQDCSSGWMTDASASGPCTFGQAAADQSGLDCGDFAFLSNGCGPYGNGQVGIILAFQPDQDHRPPPCNDIDALFPSSGAGYTTKPGNQYYGRPSVINAIVSLAFLWSMT